MANTKKYKKHTNRNAKRRTRRRMSSMSSMSSSKKHQELYTKNKKRNSIIRNIRMGRATFSRLGGGSGGGGVFGCNCQGGGGGGGNYMRKDGGGCSCQRGGSIGTEFISQFVGKPWTVSNNPNTGNYFRLSPLGDGTELVPKLDNGQPLFPAKFPTQLGPQVPKLGLMKGGGDNGDNDINQLQFTGDESGGGYSKKKRNQKTIRSLIKGGGIFDDAMGVYDNAISSATNFSSKLQGIKPPPSSYAWDQPIAYNS